MRKLLIISCFSLVCSLASAQGSEHAFGKITYEDLNLRDYPADTSASAVVLKEFGHSTIQSDEEVALVFVHYVKVKILKKEGLDRANISIPLFKNNTKSEKILSVKASSYNLVGGKIEETKLNQRQVYQEVVDKNWELKKFAVPNVREGSVIEYEYEIETPFFYQNFKSWAFQSDLPKKQTEYWATIPANWRYNIALHGPLQLKKNESDILDDYFSIGGNRSDCVRYKWSMENVPAFYEEEFMTAKENFLSAIHFELTQIEYFDGRKDKVTKEWKDVEQELKQWDKFGIQLKRGEDVLDKSVAAMIANENNGLTKAHKIFDFIRQWYEWNDNYGYYSETGIRKAFELKRGNIGDINLSLIAALRFAGLQADPLLLSTRDNGLPTDIFPIMSDFNYVVAKTDIDGKTYLLDASQDALPFGVLPQRCLNGKGRLFTKEESSWYELKPIEKSKTFSQINLKLSEDGTLTGVVKSTFMGYEAAEKRSKIWSYSSIANYKKEREADLGSNVERHEIHNLEDIMKPLIEEFSIRFDSPISDDMKSGFFSPFVVDRWKRNPFRSQQRTYPVDFGVPIEETLILTMELPSNVKASDLPAKVGMALPGNGGRFAFKVEAAERKLILSSSLVISKSVFAAAEYPYLKEFFNEVVKVQGTDLVLERL